MKSPRVMIVDDHDIVREGLRTILNRAQIDICAEAQSGQEAVLLAQRHKPDVVLMDFSLPGLDGIEATRQIRNNLPATEVLFLTMYDSEQLAREAVSAGARGFLLKTSSTTHLVPAILSLAMHKPYFTSHASSRLLENDLRLQNKMTVKGSTVPFLTTREREIVQLIAIGKSTKDLADHLNLSTRTVDAHRSNIFQKLKLHSASQLVLYAVRHGIIQPWTAC
jgi:DNA-binding NarL/FixJ family response regulator